MGDRDVRQLQQRTFSELNTQAGAELIGGFLIAERFTGQIERLLVEDERRVEQTRAVEYLVEQRGTLASGVG